MELNSVKNGFTQVVECQKLCSSKAQEVIDKIEREIESAITEIKSNQADNLSDDTSILTELYGKLVGMKPVEQLNESRKQFKVDMSKYDKALKETFITDISKSYVSNGAFESQIHNEIIARHFYHEGKFELGDSFVPEYNQAFASELKGRYGELNQIIESMKVGNIEQASIWAANQREFLLKNRSSLELNLLTLQFIQVLQRNDINAAFNYARNSLKPLISSYGNDMVRLIGSVIWVGQPNNSQYADFLSPSKMEQLQDEMKQQFFHFLGQSSKGHLRLSLAAGLKYSPHFFMAADKRASGEGILEGWEVDLDREFLFHSSFECAVCYEGVTPSNSLVKFPCHHAVCHDSLGKMSATSVFKCHQCRKEAHADECMFLYL